MILRHNKMSVINNSHRCKSDRKHYAILTLSLIALCGLCAYTVVYIQSTIITRFRCDITNCSVDRGVADRGYNCTLDICSYNWEQKMGCPYSAECHSCNTKCAKINITYCHEKSCTTSAIEKFSSNSQPYKCYIGERITCYRKNNSAPSMNFHESILENMVIPILLILDCLIMAFIMSVCVMICGKRKQDEYTEL